MREILGAASRELLPAPTESSVEPEAEVPQFIRPGQISDGGTDTDQASVADLSDARVPRASLLGRRSVAVRSVMALIVVIAAAGFFERRHRAARALAPLAEPQVAVAPDGSAAVPEPPLIATVAAILPQPKPVTVGDTPDPSAQPEAARPVLR